MIIISLVTSCDLIVFYRLQTSMLPFVLKLVSWFSHVFFYFYCCFKISQRDVTSLIFSMEIRRYILTGAGEQGVVDLVFTMGCYHAVSLSLNAFQVTYSLFGSLFILIFLSCTPP